MMITISMSLYILPVPMPYCASRSLSARFRSPQPNRTQMLNHITARSMVPSGMLYAQRG